MSDLDHLWGTDLAISPTGDLATADTPLVTQQRVLRRLLTNPGDEIWSLDYGAGLARFVGVPGATQAVRAIIRAQILKESAVSQSPEPIIELRPDPTGVLYVQIRYADAQSGTTQTIGLTA